MSEVAFHVLVIVVVLLGILMKLGFVLVVAGHVLFGETVPFGNQVANLALSVITVRNLWVARGSGTP